MSKTRQQELILQGKIIPALQSQGWVALKTSDRFKAGKLDLRMGHPRWGQMDVELKYSDGDFRELADTGLSRLQQIKMREMNEHGMPAVALVYSSPLRLFFVTSLLRDKLPPPSRCVRRGPVDASIIDGKSLFKAAMEYLNDLGYNF